MTRKEERKKERRKRKKKRKGGKKRIYSRWYHSDKTQNKRGQWIIACTPLVTLCMHVHVSSYASIITGLAVVSCRTYFQGASPFFAGYTPQGISLSLSTPQKKEKKKKRGKWCLINPMKRGNKGVPRVGIKNLKKGRRNLWKANRDASDLISRQFFFRSIETLGGIF